MGDSNDSDISDSYIFDLNVDDSFLDWILDPADNTWGPLEEAEKEDRQVTLPSADEGTSMLLDNSNNSSDWETTTVDEYIASDEDELNQQGGNVEFPPEHFYYLGESAEQRVRLFRTSGQMQQFFLRNLEQCNNLYQQLPIIFDHAIDQMTTDIQEDDLVGAAFYHPNLDNPILIHFRPRINFNGSIMVHLFERVIQSNQQITLEDPAAAIKLVTVKKLRGASSHNKRRFLTQEEFLYRGKSGCFVHINNRDNLCLPRAIVTAIARLNKEDPTYLWNSICKGDSDRHTLQKRKAMELMDEAGLSNHHGPCGIEELKKIQDVLPDYKIKLFSKEHYCAIIFEGNNDAEKVIHLYYHDQHYTVISSMPGFFPQSYWCELCNIAYRTEDNHRCINKCTSCYHRPPCKKVEIIICEECNRYFNSVFCYNNHLREYDATSTGTKTKRTKTVSICDKIHQCKSCKRHMRKSSLSKHRCGYTKCRICKQEVLIKGHQCYMQRIDVEDDSETEEEKFVDLDSCNGDSLLDDQSACAESKSKREKLEIIPRFVFFDFETTQERVLRKTQLGEELEHVPNLCIAHVICDTCQNQASDIVCHRCGPRKRTFIGVDCLDKFCRFLFNSSMKNTTAIAHNAKGFDSQFLLRYLYKEGIAPKVVSKGLNIISLTVDSIKVIDSFNFLPMPLSALPKAFRIDELCKGYFPHLFNRQENWNYVGKLPDVHFYSPETMKGESHDKFMRWYYQQTEKVFNFQEELIKYCKNDVDVLVKACLKFRNIFMRETIVDPFEKSLTIAGACNRVYRKLFLKKDTIGLVPHNGYRDKDKQSVKAIMWLQWLNVKNNLCIQHALNGKEVWVSSYKVDGIDGGTIYEFYGCYWHGCPKCMKQRNHLTADQVSTAWDAYMRTMARRQHLKQLGYQLVELWECELDILLANNLEMAEFFKKSAPVEPLNLRDAFYGGRTNAIKLYHKIEETERINYMDVCSLYPYRNKYGVYPIGHPLLITENFRDINEKPYEGLIKCLVLPPQDLYHPVLPHCSNGKSTFPLCRQCTDLQQPKCTHSNEEDRALLGTWVTMELYKALDKGYKVLKVFEVWHYEAVDRYDQISNPDGGLFTSYVNTFMKMKMEAEGWPAHCNNDASRQAYLSDIEEHEGIMLDRTEIEKNPGKPALAKLMLNSFWGKFGQRNNLTKTVYFTNPQQYFDLIFDPSAIIQSVTIISETLIAVSYTEKEEFVLTLPYVNPVIAAYTTTQARLTLFSYIEKLERRVLYFDTDSVIYLSNISDTNEYKVPIGWSLGEMTDELKDYSQGSYITEFISGGLKNYSYCVYSTKDKKLHYVTKVHGITFNHKVAKQVNFESLKQMIKSFIISNDTEEINVVTERIDRKQDHTVVTRPVQKKIRVVYDKRVIVKDFTTVPYGWKV